MSSTTIIESTKRPRIVKQFPLLLLLRLNIVLQIPTHEKTPFSHSYTPYSGKDHSKQPQNPTHDICTPHTQAITNSNAWQNTPHTQAITSFYAWQNTPLSHSYTAYSSKDHSKQPHIFTYDICTPHTHTPLGWEKEKTKQDMILWSDPHTSHPFLTSLSDLFMLIRSL